jgi:probable F420-dependent oxidoreductase
MRFGVLAGHDVAWRSASDWTEFVKRVEDSGLDCLLLPDHLGPGPGVVAALTAAAFVSERLRLGYLVLGNDFRHPVLLARETATIDVLSGGRFELGLGAGWKESEYRSLGVDYRPAAVRIERLGEALSLIDQVWSGASFSFTGTHYRLDNVPASLPPLQAPRPPVLVGGGGPQILRLAARQADIVSVMPRMRTGSPGGPIDLAEATADGLRRKIDLVRDAAGERFERLELSLTMLYLSVDNRSVPPSPGSGAWEGLSATPWGFKGSVTGAADRMRELHARYGISYFVAMDTGLDAMTRVVAELRGGW